MSKYSNVDADSLLKNVNLALSKINQKTGTMRFNDIKSSLNENATLENSVKKKTQEYFTTLISSTDINGSIKNLESRLKVLESVANLIIEIKKLEEQISVLEQRRYYYKDGERCEDSHIANQISSKHQSITANIRSIDSKLYGELAKIYK